MDNNKKLKFSNIDIKRNEELSKIVSIPGMFPSIKNHQNNK